MSDSWPEKVCTRFSDFMSKIIACASHAPVTKVPGCFGLIASDITSPLCPLKVDFAFPVFTSQRMHDMSPGAVRAGGGGWVRRAGWRGTPARGTPGRGRGAQKAAPKAAAAARARAPDEVRISVFSMKRQHER